jgi:carbamoyl-phosphate synthase large subunit
MDDDEIYLIETAARGGGAFISSDLIPLSCDLQSEELLVKMALGEISSFADLSKLDCPVRATDRGDLAIHPKQHCCYVAFYIPCGTVEAIRGTAEVLAQPYVHRTQIAHLDELVGAGYEEGQSDKTSRYLVTISAGSRKELEERMDYVRSTVQADVRTAEGTVDHLIWF